LIARSWHFAPWPQLWLRASVSVNEPNAVSQPCEARLMFRVYRFQGLALLWQIVDFAAIYRIPESIFQ
jgi:hypothetical protein